MPASTNRALALAAALAAVGVLALPGCGGSKLAYVPVTGRVTLGGKPLVGVEVAFYPEAPGKDGLPYSQAVTGPDGRYKLTCINKKDGAVVGKHRVTVNWPLPERGDDRPRQPPPSPTIPPRYAVAQMTPLVKDVPAGGEQTIDLALDAQ